MYLGFILQIQHFHWSSFDTPPHPTLRNESQLYKFSNGNFTLVSLKENLRISVQIPDRESSPLCHCVQTFFQEKPTVSLIKTLKNKNKKQPFSVARYTPISNSIYREADLVMVLGLSKKHCKQKRRIWYREKN